MPGKLTNKRLIVRRNTSDSLALEMISERIRICRAYYGFR